MWDICGRLVEANGTTPAGQIVIDNSPQAQFWPAVAACPVTTARPFLVVYNDEFHDAPDIDVTARLLDANGAPVSGYECIACSSSASEEAPDVASLDGYGYTVVWSYATSEQHIWGGRVRSDATLEAAFEISPRSGALVGFVHGWPVIASGSPLALVVWQSNGWDSGTFDIAGRLLGFRAQLPLIRR